MHGSPQLVSDAAGEKPVEGLPRLLPAVRYARHLRIPMERSFDVHPHPIQMGQQRMETIGVGACGVQRGGKSQAPNFAQRRKQRRLLCGFAAAKHHAIQQSASTLQPSMYIRPRKRCSRAPGSQIRIVTVPAAQRAALAVENSTEPSGKIQGAERRDASQHQIVRVHFEHPAGSTKNFRSLCSPNLPTLKEETGRW